MPTNLIFQCIKAIFAKITIGSQSLCFLKCFNGSQSITAKFPICTLRIIANACQCFLHELYLRMKRSSILLKRTVTLMNLIQGNRTVVTIAGNSNCSHRDAP